MTEKTPTLLPLGSAVRIKDDDSLYIIISRGFQKKGKEIIAGYAGVPHPYGQSSKYKTLTFSSQNIIEVLQKGYEDQLDKEFVQTQLGNATEAPKVSPKRTIEKEKTTPNPAQNPTVIQTKKEVVSSKTVPLAKDKGNAHPNDPFYHLRHKSNNKGK
ncbi:DUF4176 domain-containing protein [Lactococcus lactis]|jgi:Uncharacterized protein conserved in bacteria|uniref:DUF4176 domain-containing protein n=1 Tax=Lactococcus lactis TaxID=1358 RepID=UPI0024185D1E|nr:DUF4176 domain-containing protein [Lactococcus lactis]MDG4967427.1 DUF4176 domain-containing protein [Lactococcus lactis]